MAEDLGDLFQEPEDFYQPPAEATFAEYDRENVPKGEPSKIKMRLVGKSPLWGHLLWNAGLVSASYVDSLHDELKGKTVLELGAAAALPSLLTGLAARNVVSTDYPDPDLLANIQYNVDLLNEAAGRKLPIAVEGYIWGNETDSLLNAPGQNGEKFDLVILSDLIFNHSEHHKLLKACKETLAPDGKILVVFTPHRPKLFENDLAFFSLAETLGFKSEKIIEQRRSPMFEEDEETKELRSMVFGYILTWA